MLSNIVLQVIGANDPIVRGEFNSDKSIHFLVSLGLMFLVVIANLTYPKLFKAIVSGVLDPISLRDELIKNRRLKWSYLFLLLFGWLTGGMLMKQIGFGDNINANIIMGGALIMAFTLITFSVGYVLQKITYPGLQTVGAHLVDFLNFILITLSLSFISLNLFWFSGQEFASTTTVVFGVIAMAFLIFRISRGTVQLGRDGGQNLYINFFYLCAVEISPYFIFGKIMTNLT